MTLFDKINELREMRGEFLLGNEFIPVFDNFLQKYGEVKFFSFFSLHAVSGYIAFLKMCFSELLVDDIENCFRLRVNSVLKRELLSFNHSKIVNIKFLSIMSSDSIKNELLSEFDQNFSEFSLKEFFLFYSVKDTEN